MLIPAEAWTAMIDSGVEVMPVDAQHVRLRRDRWIVEMRVHSSRRALNPSDVAALAYRHRGPSLLIVPAATAAARRAAERAGWSWLVADGRRVHGMLHLGPDPIEIGGDLATGSKRPGRARSGRLPWGSLTLVRRLLEQPAATQKVLAAWAHVSQPRVSQALADLAARSLVERTEAGWTVRDFDRLTRLWLDTYPGPGGISTYWYGLDPVRDQAQAAIHLLAEQTRGRPEPVAVVSGDVAADLIAPWRNPVRAVVYARTGADLSEVGLTPAGLAEATLELIVPQDPGVWPLQQDDGPMPIADPVQVLWDVRRSPGTDSGEAATRLWKALRAHRRAVQQDVER